MSEEVGTEVAHRGLAARAKMGPQQRLPELLHSAVAVEDVPTQTTRVGAADQAVAQVRITQAEARLRVVGLLYLDFRISVTPAAQEIKEIPTVVAVVVEQEALGLTEQMSRLVMAVQDTFCHQTLVADTLQVVVVVEMASLVIQ